jgi:hypothetical protein
MILLAVAEDAAAAAVQVASAACLYDTQSLHHLLHLVVRVWDLQRMSASRVSA